MFLIIVNVLCTFLSILGFFYALQLLLGTTYKVKHSGLGFDFAEASYTVIIPAHNESLVIEATLKRVLSELTSKDNVVVVADNCCDNTADIARKMGVEVIERNHDELKGKGYALSYGVNHIKEQNIKRDCIIILDADCMVKHGALASLAYKAKDKSLPVQGVYLMEANAQSGLSEKVASFAFLIKNKIRPLGLKKIGVSAHLTGSGMAFPWEFLSADDVFSGDLAEDMMLGCKFVNNGRKVLIDENANITSYFPTEKDALLTQRRRWELGHIHTISCYVPEIFISAFKKNRPSNLLFAADLVIPPFTMFLVLLFGNILLASLTALLLQSTTALIVSTSSLFFVLSSLLVAWYFEGRNILPATSLKGLVSFILFKLKLYTTFRKRVGWEKTARDKKRQ